MERVDPLPPPPTKPGGGGGQAPVVVRRHACMGSVKPSRLRSDLSVFFPSSVLFSSAPVVYGRRERINEKKKKNGNATSTIRREQVLLCHDTTWDGGLGQKSSVWRGRMAHNALPSIPWVPIVAVSRFLFVPCRLPVLCRPFLCNGAESASSPPLWRRVLAAPFKPCRF